MQLTFSCPSCGKEYEAPWSMSGKKAHCRRCDNEFVVPAPFERKPPRSSQAIPVLGEPEPEPAPPPPPPPPVVNVGPPPNEVLEKLRTGTRATTVRLEVPPRVPTPPLEAVPEPSPAPRTMRIEAMPFSPEPPSRPVDPRARQDRGAFEPAPIPPQPRPAWLLPASAGGGLALIVALNVGLYFTFLGGGDSGSKVAKEKAPDLVVAEPPKPLEGKGPVEVAGRVVADPAPIKEVIASTRPAPSRKPKGEPAPDRVMSTSEIVSRYEPSVAIIKGKVNKKIGTGFIGRAGVVVTNAHVIEGSRVKDLEVRFPSAEIGLQGPFPAKLLHLDKDRDLALLGVATELPPVRVAEAYKFRKGEDVTVIGNPGVGGGQMILENAISRGIVSSMTTLQGHSFLQLGIAVNPGNSGGPVFDPKGRVIGVVTLKTIIQEGLAFAIPSTDLRKALDAVATSTSDKEAEDDPASSKPDRP